MTSRMFSAQRFLLNCSFLQVTFFASTVSAPSSRPPPPPLFTPLQNLNLHSALHRLPRLQSWLIPGTGTIYVISFHFRLILYSAYFLGSLDLFSWVMASWLKFVPHCLQGISLPCIISLLLLAGNSQSLLSLSDALSQRSFVKLGITDFYIFPDNPPIPLSWRHCVFVVWAKWKKEEFVRLRLKQYKTTLFRERAYLSACHLHAACGAG